MPLFFAILLIFSGCSLYQKHTYKDREETAVSFHDTNLSREAVKKDTYENQLGYFLNGELHLLKEPLLSFTHKKWYKEYYANLQIYKEKLTKRERVISDWHRQNLNFLNRKNAFYLLSGADLFHLILFFPYAENYILVSMEPSGALKTDYPEVELQSGLYSLQKILANLTDTGYLYSRTMKEYLFRQGGNGFTGTLPAFLFFIRYFGWEVLSIQEMCAGDDGSCFVSSMKYEVIDTGYNIKNIYYVSKKVFPEDFHETSGLMKFIGTFPQRGLFLKSAVYLFHFPEYENVNSYLIRNFDVIIQDDSGVPFKYLVNEFPRIRLFGNYVDATNLKGTVNPFQHDLYSAYKKEREELPFVFGYYRSRKSGYSNLIVAYR